MDVEDIIKKVRQKGVKSSFKMIAVKWKKRERDFLNPVLKHKKLNMNISLKEGYKRVIIFENHFGFYNIMQQRPQHMTKNLGDKETLVIYNSYYDIDYTDQSRTRKIGDSVYILDLYHYRESLIQATGKIKEKYLMIYSTDTVPMARIKSYERRGFKIIYEYVDDINPDLISPKKIHEIEKRHSYLIQNSNTLVVSTASKLYENIKQKAGTGRAILITNGAECRKFKPGNPTTDKEYCQWLKRDSIKVGYYGAMASWVDYKLLKEIARYQDIQLILIGIEHDNSLKESGLLSEKNVKYFGKKSYDKLAGYVDFFDVCIIPFIVNEITKATSPVKLFEYMAMEKPVVTTPLPECQKYRNVKIGYGANEFLSLIVECYNKRKDRKQMEDLRKCAWENDWSSKANELKSQLEIWERDGR